MRKSVAIFVSALAAVVAMAAVQSGVKAQTYGPGMMGGYGYGQNYMMAPGYDYGPGYMMGPGYGPGMMYGYGSDNRDYRRGPRNRGERMCWTETNSMHGYGYYAPCRR